MPIDPNDTPANITTTTSSTFGVSDAQIIGNAGNRSNPVQAIKEYQGVNAGVGRYQFPLDTPKYFMTLETSAYSRASLTSLNFTTIDTIVLPMPTNLIDTNAVAYEEGKLGMVAGQLADGFISNWNKNRQAAAQSLDQSAQSLTSLATKTLVDTATDGKTVGNVAAATGIKGVDTLANLTNGALNKFGLGADNIPNIETLLGLAGYAPNQFFVVLLKGPTYKEFTMMWRLYPRNAKESKVIKQICNKLNNAKAVGIAAGGLFWSFPYIFRLGFHPKASFLYKFKPAVLEHLVIDYAPNGSVAFFNGGAPEAVSITATFKEMEYWIESDYTDSDDITNTVGPRSGNHETPGEQ